MYDDDGGFYNEIDKRSTLYIHKKYKKWEYIPM